MGNNLENLAYTYNIRGWLNTINKNFVAGGTGNYFGMELGYDKSTSSNPTTTFAYPAFNGNISGTIWKSSGDGIARKYDYKYDNVNRITRAEFTQNTTGSTWDNSTLNFSVWGFDSDNGYGIKYDANGNLLMMIQGGWKAEQSTIIDAMHYTYFTNTNRVQQVWDDYNDPNTKLGDFHFNSGTKTATDYTYDGNGNTVADNNKAISAIGYNFLNLPNQVTVTNKGTISYVYDGAGNKLQKTTVDITASPTKTTVTSYIGGFVYQNDTLQFIGHEEGRARWAYHKYTTGSTAYSFEYDYFVKDHLGNTRVVLTQQKDTAKYIATMEGAYRATESQLFGNITTNVYARSAAPGYPVDLSVTNPNDSVARLNGSGQKLGPNLLLKVMSGDKIDLAVQYYFNTQSTPAAPVSVFSDVLNSLANGIVTAASGTKGAVTDLTNPSGSVYTGLTSFVTGNDPTPATKPKAYLNWILLDEQMKYVSSYPQSGAVAVANAGTNGGALQTPLGYTGIPITKNGYLYIWVSNETPGWDVFFDNLSVKHYPGPLLEETHYYPFGLTMAAISSKALKTNYAENKYRYNKGSELQNKEFCDGSGLELYETHYRMLDPQIGRWNQIDPKADAAINPDVSEKDETIEESLESMSPYSSMDNNPINHNDPNGDCPMCIGALIGAVVDAGLQLTEIALDKDKHISDFSWKSVAVSAVAGATGVGLVSKLEKIGEIAKIAKTAIEVAHDLTASAAHQYVTTGKVSVKGALLDATVGKIVGDKAGKYAEKLANGSQAGKILSKQLNRVERIAGENPRLSRTLKVKTAESKLDNYVGKRAAAASVSSSNVASEATKHMADKKEGGQQ